MSTFSLEDEYCACLALVHTKGLGSRTWKALLLHYGSATMCVAQAAQWTQANLTHQKQQDAFQNNSWEQAARKEHEAFSSRGDSLLLFSQSDYPEQLKQIADPPLYLYAMGNKALLNNPCLAVVGSRNSTGYGKRTAFSLGRDASRQGVTVVSGMAMGIDRQAHEGGLEAQGKTVAVLGTGLDLIYPGSNKDLWHKIVQEGLLLTEFSPGTPPDAKNFPRRNRIISGISFGVAVVEAEKESGSLVTAGLALEQDREVFAVPGPVDKSSSAGCLDLIRKGALLIRGWDDIAAELPFLERTLHRSSQNTVEAADKKNTEYAEELSLEEERIYGLIRQVQSVHFDTLVQELSMGTAELSATLLSLEMRNLVKQLPGMYYST